MAYDAGMLRAVLFELNQSCLGFHVEKIFQPAKEEIALVMRVGKGSLRLCINVGTNSPRMALTEIAKENPPVAPMFCMLLRKHLGGAKFLGAEQFGFE